LLSINTVVKGLVHVTGLSGERNIYASNSIMSNLKQEAMKTKLFLLFAGLLLSAVAFSQEKIEEVRVSPPEFMGVKGAALLIEKPTVHTQSLSEYVVSQLVYPEGDAQAFREGKEVIQFTVQTDGTLSDFVVINSVSSEMDDEVIRALKTTDGMWKPGCNNREAVSMEKEIVVAFKLAESSDLQAQATHYFVKGNKQLLLKRNPQRAIRHFDRGIVLLPNEKCLLLARGLSLYEVGDKEGACRDWNRIKALGGFESDELLDNYCEMSGYADMLKTVKE
jgi:hypothetical protein